jgi:hypothetical protein
MDKMIATHQFFYETALPILRQEFPELVDDMVLIVGGSVALGIKDDVQQDVDTELAVFQPVSENVVSRLKETWGSIDVPIPSFDRSWVDRWPDPFGRKGFKFIVAPDDSEAVESAWNMLNATAIYDPRGHFQRLKDAVRYCPDEVEWEKRLLGMWKDLNIIMNGEMKNGVSEGNILGFYMLFPRLNIFHLCFHLNRQFAPYPFKWVYHELMSCPILGREIYDLLGQYNQTEGIQRKYAILVDIVELFCRYLSENKVIKPDYLVKWNEIPVDRLPWGLAWGLS